MASKYGYVMARGIVEENEKPVWGEYDISGNFTENPALMELANGHEGAFVMPAITYRGYVEAYEEMIETFGPNGLKLTDEAFIYTRETFNARASGGGFGSVVVPAATPDDETVTKTITAAPINDQAIKSVVIRNPQKIVDPDLLGADGIILLRSGIDLKDAITGGAQSRVMSSHKSVLLSREGQMLYASEQDIGLKVDYFNPDEEGNPPPVSRFDEEVNERALLPLPQARISTSQLPDGIKVFSNEQGRYRLEYPLTGCGCFTVFQSSLLTAEIPYRNFDPQSNQPVRFYATTRQAEDACQNVGACFYLPPSVQSSIAGIYSTLASTHVRTDFKVDVMILTGEAELRSGGTAVTVGATEYHAPGGSGQDEGLLKSISLEDLEQTDLYVYRVSTGELIIERQGLKPEETQFIDDGGADANSGNARFFYRFVLRGPRVNDTLLGKLSDWWSAVGMKLGLLEQNKANFLRTGEQVKLIAINRPTGYLAAQTVTVELSAGEGGGIDIPVDKLVLQPPNIKVKAERASRENLNIPDSELKEYLIGSEGAALTSDAFIKVSTEWLDHNGTPLPEDLPGYSALLAKIIGPNQLISDQVCGSDAERIEILPGHRLQLLKLENGCDLNAEHYYVYLCGYPKSRDDSAKCFDFAAPGRPSYYVPIKVPVADNDATEQADLAYKSALRAGFTDRIRQAPAYHWRYRPEYQFSAFELEQLQTGFKQKVDEEADTIDLLTEDFNLGYQLEDENLIDVFQLIYDVVSNSNDGRLPVLGQQPNLTLAIGEQTYTLTPNPTDPQKLLNLLSNDNLKPEDFITISLYQNNDTANILWSSPEKLYAYYQIRPDEAGKHLFYPEESNDVSEFRILGGMRIQLGYMPYADEIVKEYKWSLNNSDDARFMAGSEHDAIVVSAPSGPAADKAFIEPVEWSLDPARINGTLTVTVINQQGKEKERTKEFVLVRRELSANADEPMQGSDVAMLEELLWQLGLSPQYGWPGYLGDRIDTLKHGDESLARSRDKYTAENINYFFNSNQVGKSAAQTKEGRSGSLAKMVRRFQGRHQQTSVNVENFEIGSGFRDANSNGIVEDSTLELLRVHYDQLRTAYGEYPDSPRISIGTEAQNYADAHPDFNAWVDGAIEIWDREIEDVNISGQDLTEDPLVYSQVRHDDILLPAEAITRSQLLRAWIRQEGGTYFWGRRNYLYRVTQGAGDEYGSIGFNQVLFQYVYGENDRCPELQGQNQYRPAINARNMALFMAVEQGTCDRTLIRAIHDESTRIAYNNVTRATDGDPVLRGYFRAADASDFQSVVATATDYEVDDYEQLSKAIMGYNRGPAALTENSWFGNLIDNDPGTTSPSQPVHAIHYSIAVRQNAGMRLRTYTLQSAITASEAAADANLVAGQIFCFNFGESDWHNNSTDIQIRAEVIAGTRLPVDCATGLPTPF